MTENSRIEIRDKTGRLVMMVPHGSNVFFDPYIFTDGPYEISRIVVDADAAPEQPASDTASSGLCAEVQGEDRT